MRKIFFYTLAIVISVPAGILIGHLIPTSGSEPSSWSSIVKSVIGAIFVLCVLEYQNYRKRKKEKN